MRLTNRELVPDTLPDVAALRTPIASSTASEILARQTVADRELVVASFEPADQSDVLSLYTKGLVQGWVDPFDSAADLENIQQVYLSHPRNHFWVARVRGRVVGTIAVSHDRSHVAYIRRLRVDRAWQETCVANRLLETALEHCRKCGFLKIVLETHAYMARIIELLERYGYQHARSRHTTGQPTLEFYLNLYRRTEDDETNAANTRKIGV